MINRAAVAQTGNIPTGMQFIQDSWTFEPLGKPTIIKESAHNGGRPCMRVQGLFQEADKENANLRVYPYKILREAVESIQEDIAARGVIGELNHPDSAKINLDRVSHVVTKLWMDGKKVYGEAEILDVLPCGTILKGLFEAKIRNGISSRGVGDMEMRESHGQEIYYVTEGFNFVTWDAVADPSVGGAYLTIAESRNRLVTTKKPGKFSKEAYEAKLMREFRSTLGLK